MIKAAKNIKKTVRYIEAVGRRKTAVARVRLFETNKPAVIVNDKDYLLYFPRIDLQYLITQPLKETKLLSRSRIEARIKGGGITAQAEALAHGTARVLEKFQPDLRKILKKGGFLKRDPRMKERRKFGLKKARKAPQWSKR